MQIYSPIAISGITGSLLGTASYATTVSGFGPGANNYIPKWSGSSAIGNSIIYQNGALIGLNTSSPGYTLDVNGTIKSNTYIYVGGGSNSEYAIEIGKDRTGNGYAYVDLVGDATYTDYGLRIIRGATGANSTSTISHRGTGLVTIETLEAASISLNTNNTRRLLIDGTGSLTITGSALKIDIPSKASGYVLTSDASGGATWQPTGSSGAASFPYSGSAVITGSLILKTEESDYFQINPRPITASDTGVNLLPTTIQNLQGATIISSNYFANTSSYNFGKYIRTGAASAVVLRYGGISVYSTYGTYQSGSDAQLTPVFSSTANGTQIYNLVDGTTDPQPYVVTTNLSNRVLYYEEKPSFPTLNIFNFLNFS